MFERYTEKSRRTIFFARYEAIQFGSPHIETEHLLLGVFREDKALANRFLGSYGAVEFLRHQIEGRTPTGEKISTTVDLPLSQECQSTLDYGVEEADRLDHQHIRTEHLLLGLLREKTSLAARLLNEQGVTLELVREHARQPEHNGLELWLAELESGGGGWACRRKAAGHIAIYADAQPKETEKLALIRKRIEAVKEAMEHAIGNHEFEKARFYSDEERKERENLRLLLLDHFKQEASSPRVPVLCIQIIREDRLGEIQNHCDDYFAGGVAEVWLLEPDSKRAYTVNRTDGLREFKGEILRIADPPLEMDLRTIFG